MTKDEVVSRLERYARSFSAPVREHTRVTSVELHPDGLHFLATTDNGVFQASQMVIATGALQKPRIPDYSKEFPEGIVQMAPADYRNPNALPPGAVLIVGSGQTGCQIAEELQRAGRPVYLSVGRCWWVPRRYRGKDVSNWLRFVGFMEQSVDDLPPGARTGRTNPQMSGGGGGHDISLHTLAADGVVLVGRIQSVRDGKLVFASDLSANLEWGEEQAFDLLRTIDQKILAEGLDVPEQNLDGYFRSTEGLAKESPDALDLAEVGLTTIIWATGYRPDLGWIQLPILAEDGYPVQRRGATEIPGLYFLGLDWLYKLKSGLFAGVGEDAEYLAGVITSHASAAYRAVASTNP